MAHKIRRTLVRSISLLWGVCITFALLAGTSACGPPAEAPTPTPIPLSSPTPKPDQTRGVEVTPTPVSGSLVTIPADSVSLSGEWQFTVDPQGQGVELGWAETTFDDSGWHTVTVPHTWNVMPEYFEYEGSAWYRKTFSIPAESQGGLLRLRFQAVFYLAHVWLNGTYLGMHEGGYTPFEFDVSGLVRPGVENVIAVQADNLIARDRIPAQLTASWSYDWWNYGGIVRHVSLEVSSNVYIARQQIVAVPHLVNPNEAGSAQVSVEVMVSNLSSEPFEGTLSAEIFEDATGLSALTTPLRSPLQLSPGEGALVRLSATLPNPKLWHFDHPHLYRLSTKLLTSDAQVVHTQEDTFGIRLVEIKEARFFLNGESVRLVGLTRHADSPEHGLAETVTLMAADYDDMKQLNMVFSRPVHYPQDEYILDYCDRHGILLIPEVPAWQLRASQMEDPDMRALEQGQLQEMIVAAFNHPSVWAWSIGNEIESQSVAGHEFVRDMVAFVKSLDPTRPVGFASNLLNTSPQGDATEYADFVLMNQYIGTWAGRKQDLGPALDRIHATWPDRVVIISEYGFEPRWNRWGPATDSLDPEEYYFIPENVPPDSDRADEQRRQVITDQMAVFRTKPFVVGAIFWTYQDYRTRTNFVMGVVDPERNRRGSWYVLREEYSPVLVESVSFSATAGGGRTAHVSLRTRGPVEVDMPAYTLRGYVLHWSVTSPGGVTLYEQGEISLPTLEPGSGWEAEIDFDEPGEDYVFNVWVVRPTGFTVIEQIYDNEGNLWQRP